MRLAAIPGRLLLSGKKSGRREFAARLVQQGRILRRDQTPGDIIVEAEAVKEAVEAGLFDGLAVFVDHADFFENSSVRALVGVTHSATWNDEEESADAIIRFYNKPDVVSQSGDDNKTVGYIADTRLANVIVDTLDMILSDSGEGIDPPNIGISIVFWPQWRPRDNHDQPRRIMSFRHIESADLVFGPAANGRIKEALSTHYQMPASPAQAHHKETLIMDPAEVITNDAGDEGTTPNPAQGENLDNARRETPPSETSRAAADEWTQAMANYAARAILASSDLPQASRDRLAGQEFAAPSELEAAIAAEREYLAQLAGDQVIQVGGQPPRGAQVSVGRSSLEQVEAAVEALIAGTRPPDGVRPLGGIRELYHLLSGDYEMTGRFQDDRVSLAAVNSATMAGMVANALNKQVVNRFAAYPQWWAPAVTEEDFSSLQDTRWITLGGVGELPTVPEGQAYTELTWGDQTETHAFTKKGGYLGLTLEAIDKDDTGQLRAAPRALAQAAWMTLGKTIAGIFTAQNHTGPDMSDGDALFHSNHNNLGSSALSWSAWKATREAMQKQTELNSDERLGALTSPHLLWVPIDLETLAEQILASANQPGTANNDINPNAEGSEDDRDARLRRARQRIIKVPFWDNAANWAAQADPLLYPSIGLGYRYGRQPEIFSVASPTAGLMFAADVMPIKVRFFFAVGPTDWRGLYKHNV